MIVHHHNPHVFFSNRLEILYHQLKNNLFAHSHPFTRRMILVSSPAIKSWLMFQMAEDANLQIAAGIEICFIDTALHNLWHILMPEQQKIHPVPFEPSEMELSLALEQEILRLIHTFSSLTPQEKDLWSPLLDYLKIDHDSLILYKRAEKRIAALSMKLARYFIDYGTFGGRMIEQWNSNSKAPSGWQQALWQNLEKTFNLWNYPYRKYDHATIQYTPKPQELQFHIFGLSYLAPLHHRFFMKIAEHVPVNHYLLSPCQKFWTDMLSDKESVNLKAYWQKRGVGQAQQVDLDSYLRDNNPLLANFGRLGREMHCQIEESNLLPAETYVLPASLLECTSYDDLFDNEPLLYQSSHPLTLLEAVQADIALLRNPDSTPKVMLKDYDGTIQFHSAPKPMREVEAIYNAIMGILEKHQKMDPIASSDIIVMAPNIEEYAPYIRCVFGAKESAIDYQIMDLKMASQDFFVQGFLHLLRLPLSRWDAVSLFKLFDYQAFLKKQRLSKEDVHTLRKWIKSGGIRWGKDHHHRNELLQRDHCENEIFNGRGEGTWDHGLGRLLEGLALLLNEKEMIHSSYFPSDEIDSTDAELLGKIIQLLGSLLEDLKPLSDGTKLTVKEWSIYLKCLCENYFTAESKEADNGGFQELMNQIELLGMVAPQLQEAHFVFHSIHNQLEHALNKKSVNHRENCLQAVRFCSMLPMRSIPAKVIVLMGMNDGDFPRTNERAQLNHLLHHPEADYYPSQIEFDRYLFLEAILSARHYLLLSYVSQAKGDPHEQPPSLLLTELIDYLDKSFELPQGKVSQHCLIKHSFLSFDKRYFTSNYPYRSYVHSHYAAALSHYASKKNMQHRFIPAFKAETIETEALQNVAAVNVLDLSELMACARNPLKMYFNKALGIFLEKEEDRKLLANEEMQLSTMDASMIPRDVLISSLPEVLLRAAKSGKLPSGPFEKLGADKIKNESEQLLANIETYGVAVDDIFAIEFSERYHEAKCDGKNWILPALTLITPKGVSVRLSGRLEKVSPQGLLYFGKDALIDAVKAWPAMLVLCCLKKRDHLLVTPALLFMKGKAGKAKIADFDDPENLLGDYIDYFLASKRMVSPFVPEWVGPILSGKHDELKTMIAKNSGDSFQPIYDDYLKWMGRNAKHFDAEATIGDWQVKAKDLFGSMNGAWYSKLSKAAKGVEDDLV